MASVDQRVTALPVSSGSEPRRSRLEAILTADSARERARARRHKLLGWLGVLGLPLWLRAVWPGRVSADVGVFAATIWALIFVAVLVALVGEGLAHRRRAREIATLGPLPALRTAQGAAACATPADEQD